MRNFELIMITLYVAIPQKAGLKFITIIVLLLKRNDFLCLVTFEFGILMLEVFLTKLISYKRLFSGIIRTWLSSRKLGCMTKQIIWMSFPLIIMLCQGKDTLCVVLLSWRGKISRRCSYVKQLILKCSL